MFSHSISSATNATSITLHPSAGANTTFQDRNSMKLSKRSAIAEEIIKLPKIAVIGYQSEGKSSLIEAISQIKIPHSPGTCTRCPMEVVLSSGDSARHCQVSLRIQHF